MKKVVKHTARAAKSQPFHTLLLFVLVACGLLIAGIVTHDSRTSAAGSPPSNIVTPSLSGNPIVGLTLSTTDGSWTGTPTYTYQWQSCDVNGANCSDIVGAINNTYTVAQSDAGNRLQVVVTATNVDGSTPATSDLSSVVQATLGDLNNDTVVNLFDYAIFLSHWLSVSSPEEDFNSDGVVNIFDLSIFLSNYQS